MSDTILLRTGNLKENFEVIDEESPLVESSVTSATAFTTDNEGYDATKKVNTSFLESNETVTTLDVESKPPCEEEQAAQGSISYTICTFINAIPAVLLLVMLSLMLSVPFGSAYFSPDIPLEEGKRERMGIRLSLLALAVGQFVMGGGLGTLGSSGFEILTCWQLGELSPYYHQLGEIAAKVSTDNSQILPTTLYLMSLSSISVGVIFYTLGKLKLGEMTYFFPTHVLQGLVGGVGVWLLLLSISVSISPSLLPERFLASISTTHFVTSFGIVMLLKVLRKILPKEKTMLLDPLFFLSIPFFFYLFLYMGGIPMDDAVSNGYFFQDPLKARNPESSNEEPLSAFSEAMQLWSEFSFDKVQYGAVFPAFSTLILAGIMATLLTAPFIPASGTLQSVDNELDFNREFISHGWCNVLSAFSVPGGLGVAICYSNGCLYKKAGGKGKLASIFMAALLFIVMIYGPSFVKYVPRCMAGSLLLDMGISLFMEAVEDPRSKFDSLEYVTVWIIIIVLNMVNMTAGLAAGLIMALFTYMLQSMLDKNPVRLSCDTMKLPSSKWRTHAQKRILDSPKGRKLIILFQLQGHIFFGNLSAMSKTIFSFLEDRQRHSKRYKVQCVIIDFSHVIGVDSTSVKFINSMTEKIRKQFDAKVFMVSGPLDSAEAGTNEDVDSLHFRLQSFTQSTTNRGSISLMQTPRSRAFSITPADIISLDQSFYLSPPSSHREINTKDKTNKMTIRGPYDKMMQDATMEGLFYESLDAALIKCEDEIIFKQRRDSILKDLSISRGGGEQDAILDYLMQKLDEDNVKNLVPIINHCERRMHYAGNVLWSPGEENQKAVLVVSGSVIVEQRDSGNCRHEKHVSNGEFVGLKTMILNERHGARLTMDHPSSARVLNLYLAKELARRLEHLSGISGIDLIDQ